MDENKPTSEKKGVATKQRLISAALELFSTKGFSETTIRDIATVVGIQPGSFYGHFASKEEILLYMLNDYSESTRQFFHEDELMTILQADATIEKVFELIIAFPKYLGESEYFMKLLNLVHQEQHRNDLFGNFELQRCSAGIRYYNRIFDTLKELHVFSDHVNSEYWSRAVLGVLYIQSHLSAIEIKLDRFETRSVDLADNVHYVLEMLFETGRYQGE